MSEAKHTPGPWLQREWRVLDSQGEGGLCTTVICATANNKATRTPENMANARLIAAAPDMLEALEAIQSHWQSGNFSRRQDLWDAMDAAINKARGGQ